MAAHGLEDAATLEQESTGTPLDGQFDGNSVKPAVAPDKRGNDPRDELLSSMSKEELIAIAKRNEDKATAADKRAAELADKNLKLDDKLKKSVLTDKDKRELTLAVKSTTTDIMDPVMYEQLRILSRDMFASGQVPKTYETEGQVFSAMQMGVEMGLSPRQAVLQGYFIGGRYEIWGSAVGAILRKKGWRWQFSDEEDDKVHVVLNHYSPGEKEPDETIQDDYSYEEAEASGFTTQTSKYSQQVEDKLGWRAGINRKRKLRYGVLDLVLNTYLPDIAGPMTGVVEYSEDYHEAAAADADKAAATGKEANTQRRENIGKAMASYNKRPLEEVAPRAVSVDQAQPGEDRTVITEPAE